MDVDLRDGDDFGPVHAPPQGGVYPCCLQAVDDLPLGIRVADDPALVSCPGRRSWHRGDRCRVREDGRHGIVEGWKGDQLLVLWGAANGREYRDWVPEVECDWTPGPKISSGGTKGLDDPDR